MVRNRDLVEGEAVGKGLEGIDEGDVESERGKESSREVMNERDVGRW